MDPSVVALVVGDEGVCSGVLIAPDVALTARHCTSIIAPDTSCPAKAPQVLAERDPATLRVLQGDDVITAVTVAQGLDLFVPSTDVLCGADIALVLLDRDVTNVTPAIPEGVGVARGQHVRAVGYGGDPGYKILREHVPVLSSSATELLVDERPCIGLGGGPAFDEATGHVSGVLARFGPCAGTDPFDVYTRVDVFYALVEEALASSADAGKKQSDTDTHDPTDLGGTCAHAVDCGAGVCVDAGPSQYCSQTCSATDKCPTDYGCVLVGAYEVCVQS
jgi:hypothetical protein